MNTKAKTSNKYSYSKDFKLIGLFIIFFFILGSSLSKINACTTFFLRNGEQIVIVTNNLVLADTGLDESVETNSIYLSANEPIRGIGTWSVLEGEASFSDENDYSTLAYNLKLGLNKLIWEITNKNCSDKDTVDITYDLKNSVSLLSNEFSFNIYPNPTSQIINFSFISSERRKCSVKIFNIKGQKVYSENNELSTGRSTHLIDISILPKGTYMLSVSTKKDKMNMKFLKL